MSTGTVTGMEMVTDGLSREHAINRAWTRALSAAHRSGFRLGNLKQHLVKVHSPLNQDAIRVTVSADSSLWTGR